MSRTYRKQGYTYHKHPKGAKKAKMYKCRSVPPDEYDDCRRASNLNKWSKKSA